MRKLSGGALIIERASELTNETAIRLEVAMRGQTGELLFIFEDEKQSLKTVYEAASEAGSYVHDEDRHSDFQQ